MFKENLEDQNPTYKNSRENTENFIIERCEFPVK